MKPESIAVIKKELKQKSSEELLLVCLRLAKYKVENKELLNFLLFNEQHLDSYLAELKAEVEEQFELINSANLYWAKKSIRKILRLVNKHIKYTGSKEAEAEMLIHFCEMLKESGIPFSKSTTLLNLYERQIMRIEKAVATMHEDLQFDVNQEIEEKGLRLNYFN